MNPGSATQDTHDLVLPHGRTVGEELAGINRFSGLMDTRFSIGGVRFGLDSVIGLVPVAGDAVTGFAGIYALATAARLKLPFWVHIQIVLNLLVDSTLGAIPLAGDVFDFFFRSHRRNFRIVEKHLVRRAQRHQKALARQSDA